MKLVYIAGPYGDSGGYLAIDQNIARAREAAAWLAAHGLGYYCPHLNSAHFEAIVPAVPLEFWYAMDIAFMPVCDAMLLLERSHLSKGTAMEMIEWEKTGKPLFYPWQRDDLLAWAAQ